MLFEDATHDSEHLASLLASEAHGSNVEITSPRLDTAKIGEVHFIGDIVGRPIPAFDNQPKNRLHFPKTSSIWFTFLFSARQGLFER
jgi:hypothetical protein